eukprot:GHVL01042459.1.p1 GENE.GHVL01042459.1~~GHVL01042459.1.p1  ORF type:complete len:571 (+),score=13.98 GHVL01042459.1:38-1750(+)
MAGAVFALHLLMLSGLVSSELIQNGGFENNSMDHWGHCWGFSCEVIPADDSRFGSHSLKATGRTHSYQGPSQLVNVAPGKIYKAQSWMKILKDKPGTIGQTMMLEVSFEFPDGQHSYFNVALQPLLTAGDGWVFLAGEFETPPQNFKSANFYYQGPEPEVDFAVDQASITEVHVSSQWRVQTDANINKYRKSDLKITVSPASGIDRSKVQIRILQKTKAFPFGTCVNSWKYIDPSQTKYQDFIHKHFNWAVLENALKWGQLERNQGQLNYDRALKTVNGLKDHGLKVRGHNMVWSVDQYVQSWMKSMTGDTLRNTVRQHIQWTLNMTQGLLEHWDVNNENLHGQWFQNQLHDRDFDLELFRMMYQADPYPKLFLNEYSVVGSGAATTAYREQGMRFKNASVHLYGMGVQSHFGRGVEPNPTLIKQRLDTLAEVGVPLWTTELDVQNDDENVRADWYEQALRALYGHPAIEGILFWGFWGDIQSGGQRAGLVTGPDLHLTAAGRRVLDLFENQWMTDETHVLSQSGDHFTVRGFHGDYELHVMYQGHQLTNLKKTFTLGKQGNVINVNVHT